MGEGIGCVQSSPAYRNEVKSLFIDAVNNFDLEQFVTQPTRNQNIIDLVFTTYLDDTNVVPDISDHEVVTFQIKLPRVFP